MFTVADKLNYEQIETENLIMNMVGLVPWISESVFFIDSAIGPWISLCILNPSVNYLLVGGIGPKGSPPPPPIFLLILFINWLELVPRFSSLYYLSTGVSLDLSLCIIWYWSLDFPLHIIYGLSSVVHRSGRGREGGEPQVLGQDRA
jgi:hypothetical protein